MKKILVVDDVEETRELLNFSLTSNGYEVIEEENGKMVIETVLGEKPNLIILDIGLPGLDGYTIATMLFGNSQTKNIPVILSTAYTNLSQLYETKKMTPNVVDFIAKPYLPEEILNKIQKAIGNP